VGDEENLAIAGLPDGDEAMLRHRVVGVGPRSGKRIEEHCAGFREGNAMLLEVRRCLLSVPLIAQHLAILQRSESRLTDYEFSGATRLGCWAKPQLVDARRENGGDHTRVASAATRG
jgi:hypothetical protein